MAHYVDNPTLNYRELHHSTGRHRRLTPIEFEMIEPAAHAA
jgi:predicted methyltransferase